MNLQCKWCEEMKPAEQFIKRKTSEPYSQSNVRCCKTCNATRNRARYAAIPRVREVQLAANARWSREHRDRANASHDKYHAKNPSRQQARNRVAYLLRAGVLSRQPCAICGAPETEGHHDSYAREDWGTVRWLCKAHHEQWHVALDSIRAPILDEPLRQSQARRTEARKKLDKIYRLRLEVAELQNEADRMEAAAWAKVKTVANHEFTKLFNGA